MHSPQALTRFARSVEGAHRRALIGWRGEAAPRRCPRSSCCAGKCVTQVCCVSKNVESSQNKAVYESSRSSASTANAAASALVPHLTVMRTPGTPGRAVTSAMSACCGGSVATA